MDISEIQKTKSVKSVERKEPLSAPAKVEDSLSISSDPKKIDQWVEMLKEMPEIRSEIVDAALSRELPSDAPALIAQKMMEVSDF